MLIAFIKFSKLVKEYDNQFKVDLSSSYKNVKIYSLFFCTCIQFLYVVGKSTFMWIITVSKKLVPFWSILDGLYHIGSTGNRMIDPVKSDISGPALVSTLWIWPINSIFYSLNANASIILQKCNFIHDMVPKNVCFMSL